MTKGEARKSAALKEGLSSQELHLGKYKEAFDEGIGVLASEQFVERLWAKDATLWKKDAKTQEQIKESLGWLDVTEKMALHVEDVYEFLAEALSVGLKHAVLMGMGGSSLAPLLFGRTFPVGEGGMSLRVLDTTDPATILTIEKEAPIAETLFVVASKSGTTAEPNAFGEYFFAKADALKEITAGGNFAAITDPGSALETLARNRCFRGVIHNFKDIGGRYSALSYFGLVPAALMGLDIDKLVLRALRMQKACSFDGPISENPGVALGAAIGELAKKGVDKLTFLMPEAINTLGLWLEQLIAESTGKEGTGVLPVAEEPPGEVSDYGDDRFFAYISVKGYKDRSLEALVEELKKDGKPIVEIRLNDLFDLAQEFYRWEIATATAGRILGINPFDQPNVQESKDSTNRLIEEVRTKGMLTEPEPSLREGNLAFYADIADGDGKTILQRFLALASPGDYVAFQAYLAENPSITGPLQEMRKAIRSSLGVATTLGYGPRFLHSTGQFHKGGPNNGLFIQLTADDAEDAAIPGTNYTFGILKQAQAAGDLEALKKHGRRIMRVHLGKDVEKGLAQLLKMLKEGLTSKEA
jgi:transaldolase / glucose-6-phosphate isomerase